LCRILIGANIPILYLTLLQSSDHIEPGTTSSGQHYLGDDGDDDDAYRDRQPLLYDAESVLVDPNADADDTDGIEYSGLQDMTF
jgi:hypothetical protein